MSRPLLQLEGHLGELRNRIITYLVVFLPVAVWFFFHATGLTQFLLLATGGRIKELIFISPSELFFTYIQASLVAALIVTSPLLIYEVAAFVWPGLTREERHLVISYAPAALFLLWAGAAFAFFVFAPVVFRFLFSFTGPVVHPMITYSSYVDFIIGLMLPLAIVFEFPLVVMALTRLGLISAHWLRQKRRMAIFIIFVLAAAFAPPDLMSMLVLASPMLVLYEVGVWLSALAERQRRRNEPPEDSDEEPPAEE
jgi:sec-independent protein translocase protein TatC